MQIMYHVVRNMEARTSADHAATARMLLRAVRGSWGRPPSRVPRSRVCHDGNLTHV